MNRSSAFTVFFCGLLALTGCTAMNRIMGRGPRVEKPKILVLPFDCANQEIGTAITQGFIKELDSSVEALNAPAFELFVATRAKGGLQTLPGLGSLPGVPALSSGSVPSSPPGPSGKELLKDLPNSAQARHRLYKEGGIAYLVAGQAKEQIWSELEAANIKTAASAGIRLWDLSTDELLSEEPFQQGMFEIVAPDRIGVKLADRVNRRFKDIHKEDELRTLQNSR